MNTKDTAKFTKTTEARDTRVDRAIRQLMSLDCDPKQRKRQEFERFYPAVLHAMSRKVPRKTILKHLSEGGLKLYPSLFDEFMESMAKSYESQGSHVSCNSCGQEITNSKRRSTSTMPDAVHATHQGECTSEVSTEEDDL